MAQVSEAGAGRARFHKRRRAGDELPHDYPERVHVARGVEVPQREDLWSHEEWRADAHVHRVRMPAGEAAGEAKVGDLDRGRLLQRRRGAPTAARALQSTCPLQVAGLSCWVAVAFMALGPLGMPGRKHARAGVRAQGRSQMEATVLGCREGACAAQHRCNRTETPEDSVEGKGLCRHCATAHSGKAEHSGKANHKPLYFNRGNKCCSGGAAP